ncbi:hypothetical protein PC119_g8070 [Phytophthora cactorum]|nr:hypothetical protein PC119_g8070 [Phytophthora cactorum]
MSSRGDGNEGNTGRFASFRTLAVAIGVQAGVTPSPGESVGLLHGLAALSAPIKLVNDGLETELLAGVVADNDGSEKSPKPENNGGRPDRGGFVTDDDSLKLGNNAMPTREINSFASTSFVRQRQRELLHQIARSTLEMRPQ